MKTCIITVIVAAVGMATGSNAFVAPGRGKPSLATVVFPRIESTTTITTTSLFSHFTSINTKLYHKEPLVKALNDLVGIQNVVQSVEKDQEQQKLQARGYQGESIDADIVIRQPNNNNNINEEYDIAFCYNGESYQLQADLQFWKQRMPVDAFLEKLHQQYAIHTLIDHSTKDGFVVEQIQSNVQDGSVTMQLSRYNTNHMVSAGGGAKW